MGSATVLDELKALLDGLNIVEGTHDVTFEWVEWEEKEEARGAFISGDIEDAVLSVSDIGGGAQESTELIRVRAYYEVASDRATNYSAWKNTLVAGVLSAIRGNEKGFTGGYYVEVTDIEFEHFPIDPEGRGARNMTHQADFLLTARRHDVYG